MVKTMVKRGGPHKLNWKRFFQGFHDYDNDDSGVGGDGDDDKGEGRGGPDKLNWRGFIQRISRTWAEGGEPLFNKRRTSKVTKEK